MVTLIDQQTNEPACRIHHRYCENKMDDQDMKLDPDNNTVNEFNQITKAHSFIVTENLKEDVLDRQDVPDWFKDQVLNDEIEENRNVDIVNETINQTETPKPYRTQIIWRNVAAMTLIHIFAFYGFYLFVRYNKLKLLTLFWIGSIGLFSAIGVLAGAHRLWTHRSYKAHWILRTILMIAQTTALQDNIYAWVRDHRVHHKYSETDADPHNSNRGFFFAHMGWLLCRKHPLVKIKGSQIDMSDVWDDPIVRFQRRFYIPLVMIFWGLIPVYVPVIFWGESLLISFLLNFFRHVVGLHHAFLVNSAAHMYGYKFYDKSMKPREIIWVTYLTFGEGYHNYHHTFPWDYSASEHGWRYNFNPTTFFIDINAWLGLASERRVVSRSVIEKRSLRTGDLSLIPTGYTADRKPYSFIWDLVLGLSVSTYIFWIPIVAHTIFRD